MTRWVVNLQDDEAADAHLTGGKAAALARLMAAGLPVPEAFVVTTEAFRAHFPVAVPGERPPAPPFQLPLAQAINAALAAQFDTGAYLAVRSSAPGEDGDTASFAGQHETYYYIGPDDVAQAVMDCWLSLWSERARSYRAQQASDADGCFAMAVIVQRMVQADRSGVCFTADPTGRRPQQVVIEATWGLGAALVDGRVSPDRLLMDRSGRLLQRLTGRKRHKVAAALRRPRETRLEPVPLFQQTLPVLDDAEAAEVLELGLTAERWCGPPQDVEWAYEGATLYLLQSRPVTTARPPADRHQPAAPDGQWVLYKPLAENFTEPLTPMTVDLFQRVLPPIGRFIDGRYYLRLDIAQRWIPLRCSSRELAELMLLRGEVPQLRWDWGKLPFAVIGLAAAYLTDGIAWHRSAHLSRESLHQYTRVCEHIRADTALSDIAGDLQRLVTGRHPFEPIGRMAYYVNVSAGRYFLLLGVLRKLMERWAPGFDPQLLSQLCSGDGDTFSRRLVEGVRALADEARRDEQLTGRLTTHHARDLEDVLTSLPPRHPFVLALGDFLATFGHRCMREMELAVPRWREDPLPVLLMVRGYLRSPRSTPTEPRALHLAAMDTVREALPPRWQQRVVIRLIERVRYYTSLREDTRHYHAMAMDVIRSKLLELEQHLLARERLRLAGDIFYLSWDEARALRDDELGWSEVAGRIRHRRRRERRLQRAGATEVVGMPAPAGAAVQDATCEPRHAGDGRAVTTLHGHCASPGTASGRVRIVLDPATAHDLTAGDILVAPYTDPAWTPLFPLAAAVIVEVGSFLSHAGTVAREYGIPCVVDVADCTTRLREGQQVRVIAADGRVEVLST